ncbi:MAG: tetratricopeptide repeat protein, partial [Kiritimatiellaceae bacterium]|nr:tetratricopeptide repeat protein [Kiritimatiellaceae bacterium]
MYRLLLILLLLLGLNPVVFAFEEELRFVDELTKEGFPNLAEIVLQRTVRRYPEAEQTSPELQIRILLANQQFEQAQANIMTISNAAPYWLLMAEAARRSGRESFEEAAYTNYFASNIAADDATVQAAFRYGEILEGRAEKSTAQALYERVVALPRIGRSARPIQMKLAKCLMEKEPERAKMLCDSVQLGGLDLWFSQAVVLSAQRLIQRKEWVEAQSVLETQMETLRDIHDALKQQGQPVEQISPLAGARYYLGLCYEQADRKPEALVQFYNVYIQYGASEWGSMAQQHAESIMGFFKAQGKVVQIDLGEHRSTMGLSAFRAANRLFSEKQYAEALQAYLAALCTYPEGDEAVAALRDVSRCQLHLNDFLGVKVVAGDLGERFATREAAADALLTLGREALDSEQSALAEWVYERYFGSFPNHPRAPGVMYSWARLQADDQQSVGLLRVLKTYPDSPYAVQARHQLAWNAYESKDYLLAIEQFELILQAESDFQKQTRSRFALAESYRLSSHWKSALTHYQIVEQSLGRLEPSDELQGFCQSFFGQSIFYQGICLAKCGELEKAVKHFERLLAQFPES